MTRSPSGLMKHRLRVAVLNVDGVGVLAALNGVKHLLERASKDVALEEAHITSKVRGSLLIEIDIEADIVGRLGLSGQQSAVHGLQVLLATVLEQILSAPPCERNGEEVLVICIGGDVHLHAIKVGQSYIKNFLLVAASELNPGLDGLLDNAVVIVE
eukprot:Mycagemm_TRINITY_DN9875_c0_g1::TRINITY_DN9875_c0_g1_i1::g.253::m.253 type:complete len:157 gc:universal TRINITY_DN9875_c0_g1_i1:527-57(-)